MDHSHLVLWLWCLLAMAIPVMAGRSVGPVAHPDPAPADECPPVPGNLTSPWTGGQDDPDAWLSGVAGRGSHGPAFGGPAPDDSGGDPPGEDTDIGLPGPLAYSNARWAVACLSHSTAWGIGGERVLDVLARYLVSVRCPRGEVLCQPGEQPAGLVIVQDGVVELVMRTGQTKTVAQVLCRGDVFGAEQMICGRPTPWLARASSHVSYLFLPRAGFQALLETCPGATSYLVMGFACRLVSNSLRLAAALGRKMEERAARILLLEERGGVVPLSQSALAAMAGISRPSLNKVLRELARQHAIDTTYRRIRVLDKPRLTELAGLGP